MTYGAHLHTPDRLDMWEPDDYCTQCGCGLSAIDIANHWRICQWCARENTNNERAEYAHDDTGKEETPDD